MRRVIAKVEEIKQCVGDIDRPAYNARDNPALLDIVAQSLPESLSPKQINKTVINSRLHPLNGGRDS